MLKLESFAPKSGPQHDIYRAGRGAPFVWLHGLAGVKADDPLLDLLARDLGVFAPLMPGRRDLAELEDMRDIRDLALHYEGLFEDLGIDKIHLAGHSFGGMLAAEIAAHWPKRVATLTLVSPLGLWNDNAPIEDLFARPHAQIDELLWAGAARRPSAKSSAATDNDVESLVELANTLGSFAKFIWPIPDRGLRRRLHRIGAPALIVFGEQDAYVPASYADEFARGIDGSRRLVLKGSHMIAHEQPQEVAAAILALAK